MTAEEFASLEAVATEIEGQQFERLATDAFNMGQIMANEFINQIQQREDERFFRALEIWSSLYPRLFP